MDYASYCEQQKQLRKVWEAQLNPIRIEMNAFDLSTAFRLAHKKMEDFDFPGHPKREPYPTQWTLTLSRTAFEYTKYCNTEEQFVFEFTLEIKG